MHKEIFINADSQETRFVMLHDKRIEEFQIERRDYTSIVGNIYKGRVESVLPGIDAAFVNIGTGKNGFLHVADVVTGTSSYEKLLGERDEEARDEREKEKALPSITEVLKKGDEVLVQVVKDPISTKGARLTTHISIPGRFLVLMPFDNHTGISRRIEEHKERDRIRKILSDLKLPTDIGFIVRTAAKSMSQKEFAGESRYLLRLWQNINQKAKRSRPPQLIHKEYELVLRAARDFFTHDVSKFEVDSRDDFGKVIKFLRIYAPHLRSRLKFYQDRMPLFEKFDIEKQIDKIYERVVHLKCGGSLIFDETESLVAIDVNSGKSVGERNLEQTAFKTNMEAAEEIPRQLKLRDIGGIIIIDFIDMEDHGHRKTVSKTLERSLEDDKARTKILNISSIGLVEMTRQRLRKSVEGKSYQRCPYCNGRGTVKSASTMSIELSRKIVGALAASRQRQIYVTLNPEVAHYISEHNKNMIRSLERRFRKNINIVENPSLHIEDMHIE